MNAYDVVEFILFFAVCYMALTVILIHTELKKITYGLKELTKKLDTIILGLRKK